MKVIKLSWLAAEKSTTVKINKLINAVIYWSTMPPSGTKKWPSDFSYLAEYVVPLAIDLKEKCHPKLNTTAEGVN